MTEEMLREAKKRYNSLFYQLYQKDNERAKEYSKAYYQKNKAKIDARHKARKRKLIEVWCETEAKTGGQLTGF